ncbi:ATP synthase F1 subunit delta [bacterium]|nr:ATP synthase F1 subunit delta [bacterium]
MNPEHDPVVTGYAQAWLALAQAEDAVARVEEEVFRLRDLLRQNPDLLQFLKDPNVQREGKRQALSELFEGRVHGLVLNGLLTVGDQDRAARLPRILESFLALAAAAKQTVSGEVVTAVPLDDATRQRLEAELGRLTGKNVRLLARVDPSLVGGALIQVGEQVIDGSLRRRLSQIKEQLLK